VKGASSVPKSASMIKVKLPYLYFCLEIVANLKMGARVKAFAWEFNGIKDFVGGKRFFKLKTW
jgi:hypothetical protein